MRPLKILNLSKEILSLELLSNQRAGVITKDGAFRIITLYDGSLIDGFKLSKVMLEESYKLSKFSPMQKYAIYADKLENALIILDMETKKPLYKCAILLEKISAITIDSKDRYLVTGGVDGKVFIWDLKSGEFIQKEPPHPDAITALSFNPSGSYLVSADYSGCIVISNLSSNTKKERLTILEKQKINKILFLDEHRLILCGDKGDLVLLNILKPTSKKIIKHSIYGIVNIQESIKNEYLFVLTRDSKVSIVDSKDLRLVAQNIFETEDEISEILSSKDSDILLVGTKKGKLHFYKLHDESELKKAIDEQKYEEAYNIIEENTLLMGGNEYKRLEQIWHDRFEDAFRFMMLKEYEKANELLAPFKNVKDKRVIIQKLNNEFKNYEKLEEFIRTGSLNPAYSLVANTEYLKKAHIFIELENRWEEAFKDAKELILKYNNIEAAKERVKEFYQVQTKAPLINALLRNKELFIEMRTLIKQKDFRRFFNLVAKNRFLKETSEYKMVLNYGDRLLESVKIRLKNRQYKEILSDIEKLTEFKHLEDEVNEILGFSKVALSFLDLYKKREYLECYRMIDQHPFLLGFDEAKNLEEKWQRIVYDANIAASKGDVVAIKELLNDYMALESRHQKIGSIFRQAFYTQLRNESKKESIDAQKIENGLKKFVVIFGYDDDVEYLIKYLKKEHKIDIMLNSSQKNDKENNWYEVTKGKFPDEIFS